MVPFFRDLRFSVRSLGRTPGLTAMLIATVAVGIGTHAALSGFTNGLLARTAVGAGGQPVVVIQWHAGPDRALPVPADAFTRLRNSPLFEAVAAVRESRVRVTLAGREAWMSAAAASPEIWKVLAVPPALGKMAFAASADGAIGVIASHRIWRNELGGRPDAIGMDVIVSSRKGRLAGVAPESFEGLYLGRAIDVWVPLDEPSGTRAVSMLARLEPSSTIERAQTDATALAGRDPGPTLVRYSGVEPDVESKFARVRNLLAWAAMLVLLTAGANVAGFLLSRSARRAHETAARVALGATRARLAGLIVADGVVISVAGGALGAVVAYWTASALPALLYVEDAERLRLATDPWEVALSAATYTLIMLACALAPLAQIEQHGPMTVLRRSGGPLVESGGWLRSALIVAQMGVTVVLGIGAALLFQEFRAALASGRGDRLGQPIVAVVEAAARYGNPQAGRQYFSRLEHETKGASQIASVDWISTLPGGRPSTAVVRLEQAPAGRTHASIDAMTPSGRDLIAMTLTSGRMFGGQDDPSSCRVALMNEAASVKYFGGEALGRSFQDASGRRVDVVGVVKKGKDAAEDPRVYFYERQTLVSPSHNVEAKPVSLPIPPAAPAVSPDVDMDIDVASPGYFSAIGATFEAGHGFESAAGCEMAVVNREAAQAYFGGKALGAAIIEPDGRRTEIAGIIDEDGLRLLQRRPEPTVYFSMARRYLPRMTLIAGTRKATPKLVEEIDRRLSAVDGALSPPTVSTMEQQLSRTALGPERIAMVLVAASAAIALGLGLLGAYGIMSDAVVQRKREIALRLALGAQSWKIVGGVLRDGGRVAATGVAAGLAASWILVAIVRHSNPGVDKPALWMWLACPLVLAAVVVIAGILPARWALAVDPLTLTREG
ncbi:MAG TPA: ABC transporter permease [Vicinamibacterales bacterium]|nr:ABC transporter permease [Vicinamibacterales bacterium]